MANRYWVGGANTWNGTAGTKWATTSGGAGGAAVPTSSDDVFFDAASGAVTITLSGTRPCKNFDTTGFTGTFAGSSTLEVSGHLTLGAGMNYTMTGLLSMIASSGTWNITTNGVTITSMFRIGRFNITGSTAVFNQQDDLNIFSASGNYPFKIDLDSSPARVYNTNNNDINITAAGNTVPLFEVASGVFNAGSSVFTIENTTLGNALSGFILEGLGGQTIVWNKGTSIINLINCSLSLRRALDTLGEVNISADSLQYITIEIQEGSVVEDLTISSSSPLPIFYWTPDNIAEITSFTANGTEEIPLVFRTAYAREDGEWGIACEIANVSYVDVQDSTASGAAAPFVDFPGGIDSGNNVGWIFYEPQLPDYNPSVITAVKAVQQNTNFPHFIIGGKGTGNTYALFKKSTVYGFHVWRSSVYIIGKKFDVEDIVFPVFPGISGNMEIKPVLYFDNETVVSPGELINVSNYPNEERLIKLSSKNFNNKVAGKSNFFLELQSLGEDLAVVGLPIDIGLEVKD